MPHSSLPWPNALPTTDTELHFHAIANFVKTFDFKPDDRLVIQLLDLEQKTLVEISGLTGWNQTLIKVRAFRARRKLQKLFQDLQQQEKS